MLNDPRVYPEPEKFNPDRYLKGEGRTPQPDPRGPAFGFGRRVCPGKDLAENTVWAMVASLFHAFRITPARDANGREIPIPNEFEEHAVRYVAFGRGLGAENGRMLMMVVDAIDTRSRSSARSSRAIRRRSTSFGRRLSSKPYTRNSSLYRDWVLTRRPQLGIVSA